MAPNKPIDQAREDKRKMAINNVNDLKSKLEIRALDWQIAARNIGSAYKMADNKFRETLSKKAASDALEIQIFFSVLTVVTSGALGWVSTAVAKTRGGVESAMSDAVEATSQAFAGELFSANGPLVFPPSNASPLSQDPQVFQNDLENKVDRVHRNALIMFDQVKSQLSKMSPEAFDRYDNAAQLEAQRKWEVEAKKLAGDDDLPEVQWMADEIERGRWKRYVLDNHSYRDFGIFQTRDTPDDVGGDVRDRISELTDFSFDKLHMSKDEEEGVVRYWANHYIPQDFVDYKKGIRVPRYDEEDNRVWRNQHPLQPWQGR
jgi:hypothetical protein